MKKTVVLLLVLLLCAGIAGCNRTPEETFQGAYHNGNNLYVFEPADWGIGEAGGECLYYYGGVLSQTTAWYIQDGVIYRNGTAEFFRIGPGLIDLRSRISVAEVNRNGMISTGENGISIDDDVYDHVILRSDGTCQLFYNGLFSFESRLGTYEVRDAQIIVKYEEEEVARFYLYGDGVYRNLYVRV